MSNMIFHIRWFTNGASHFPQPLWPESTATSDGCMYFFFRSLLLAVVPFVFLPQLYGIDPLLYHTWTGIQKLPLQTQVDARDSDTTRWVCCGVDCDAPTCEHANKNVLTMYFILHFFFYFSFIDFISFRHCFNLSCSLVFFSLLASFLSWCPLLFCCLLWFCIAMSPASRDGITSRQSRCLAPALVVLDMLVNCLIALLVLFSFFFWLSLVLGVLLCLVSFTDCKRIMNLLQRLGIALISIQKHLCWEVI
jgi:hypothetical protein